MKLVRTFLQFEASSDPICMFESGLQYLNLTFVKAS